MTTIILSYRRDDTAWIAGRIHDRLAGHFGKDTVFMDIDSIPFGLDFREHIQDSLKRCDILVAIIGPRWAATNEQGQARLFEENDWVRIEIEGALARKIPVIPVLVDGAKLPPAGELPESVRNIVFRQAAELDAGRDFHPHMDRLIGAMDQLLARENLPQPPPPSPSYDEPKPEPEKPEPIPKKDVKQPETHEGKGGTEEPAWRSNWWRLLTSPEGRLPRLNYALALIASFVAMNLLVLAVGLPYNEVTGRSGTPPIILFFPLLGMWVVIALAAKRLHDIDWPAWPVAIPLVLAVIVPPYLGWAGDLWPRMLAGTVLATVLLLLSPLGWMRGTQGPNRYGPDPLGGAAPNP